MSARACFSALRSSVLGVVAVVRWLRANMKPRNLLLLLIALPVMSIYLLSSKQAQWTPGLRRGPKCIGWRGTSGCLAFRSTEKHLAKSCDWTVRGHAGYCLCEGGVTVARMNCGPHRFKCRDKCAELAYDSSGALVLPEPLTCNDNTTGVPPLVVDPRALDLPELDTDQLSRSASNYWDQLDELIAQNGFGDVRLPHTRDHKHDWVKEGVSLDRSDVAQLQAGVEAFKAGIPPYPGTDMFDGRGIVMVGGGMRYLVPAWASINVLRRTGCTLPIELWFPVEEFPTLEVEAVLANQLGVTPRRLDLRDLGQHGFTIKVAALLLSRFREVLFLDADNAAVLNPEFLFDTPEYKQSGALFWPDFWDRTVAPEVSEILNISVSDMPTGSFESGQMVIDKQRHWRGLIMAVYINAYAATFYELLSCYLGKGDKETFAYGMLAAGEPIWLNNISASSAGMHQTICKRKTTHCQQEFLGNTMVQHAPNGSLLFFHANYGKWTLDLPADFASYHRRWLAVEPEGTDLRALKRTLGYDPELEVYQALVRFRCAPWFDNYYRARMRVGERTAVGLQGFHAMSDYMRFAPFYRKGWTGAYVHTVFKPTWTDWLVNQWFIRVRWPLRGWSTRRKKAEG